MCLLIERDSILKYKDSLQYNDSEHSWTIYKDLFRCKLSIIGSDTILQMTKFQNFDGYPNLSMKVNFDMNPIISSPVYITTAHTQEYNFFVRYLMHNGNICECCKLFKDFDTEQYTHFVFDRIDGKDIITALKEKEGIKIFVTARNRANKSEYRKELIAEHELSLPSILNINEKHMYEYDRTISIEKDNTLMFSFHICLYDNNICTPAWCTSYISNKLIEENNHELCKLIHSYMRMYDRDVVSEQYAIGDSIAKSMYSPITCPLLKVECTSVYRNGDSVFRVVYIGERERGCPTIMQYVGRNGKYVITDVNFFDFDTEEKRELMRELIYIVPHSSSSDLPYCDLIISAGSKILFNKDNAVCSQNNLGYSVEEKRRCWTKEELLLFSQNGGDTYLELLKYDNSTRRTYKVKKYIRNYVPPVICTWLKDSCVEK
jgi:hypothetical protein